MSADPTLLASSQAALALAALTARSLGEPTADEPVELLADALIQAIYAEPMTEARAQLLGALAKYLEV